MAHRRSKTANSDEYHPLNLGGILEASPPLPPSPPRTPGGPGAVPSRHPRDATAPRHHHRNSLQKKKPSRHERSLSLGSDSHAGGGGMGGMMGNACMFTIIAKLEPNRNLAIATTPTSMMSRCGTSCASLEWDGSVVGFAQQQQHSFGGQSGTAGDYPPSSSGGFVLGTPGSVLTEGRLSLTGPASTPSSRISPGLEGGDDDADSENSSYGSFSAEYHRPEQKHKIVAKEVKHIIGRVLPMGKPVVKAGRKLLGRDKEGRLKRSGGCLT